MTVAARVAGIDWPRAYDDLDRDGWAHVPGLLTATECERLNAVYDDERHFRSTIDMERHRFGRGQYRYFAYPLPPLVDALRQGVYPRLQPVANRWAKHLRRAATYPPRLDDFLARCHDAGQTRPTPLLLRYAAGDYNCLHQDIYGALAFPLQLSVLISRPGRDFDGGTIVLVEQRPRAQSKATAIWLERGAALIFTNRERPVQGTRGWYAVQMRHGVSPLTRGRRLVLGVIFHDAR